MIIFDEVKKSFKEDFWKKKKTVIENLSFSVEPGSLCGFLGANGAGKTTSIKSLLGFINIDSGDIRFHDSLKSGVNDVREVIGYFPEGPYFYPFMTGREFCLYLGKLQNVKRVRINEQIKYWSERLSIDFALDQKIRGYSKGMLQRLGFLTSLLHEPKLVVLDEPLSGLDPLGRKEFKDILIDLNKKGVTCFFSSHIVADVQEICDSLVVIQKGNLFYEGKTTSLLAEKEVKSCRVYFQFFQGQDSLPDYLEIINIKEDFCDAKITLSKREQFLKWLSDSGNRLEELVLERPTLEEIIYDSRRGA